MLVAHFGRYLSDHTVSLSVAYVGFRKGTTSVTAFRPTLEPSSRSPTTCETAAGVPDADLELIHG